MRSKNAEILSGRVRHFVQNLASKLCFANDAFHIILSRWNSEICEHFFLIIDEIVF